MSALAAHRVGEVQNDKGAVGHARFLEVRVSLARQVLVVQLPHVALIGTFGHLMRNTDNHDGDLELWEIITKSTELKESKKDP